MPKLSSITNKLYNFRYALLITFAILIHFLARPIYAQGQNPWFNPDPKEHEAALEACKAGNVGLECTVQAIVSAVENSLSQHTSPSPASLSRGNSITQFASNMVIKLISHPPVSSTHYLDYMARKINPIKPAYAQSTGYRALSSLVNIWTAFRNVAYLAFVVIFIFIGLMIMFRAQINPQTVIGIQNALPKLVVTLLLVTFSFAIAGLMVDLIYVGIFLAVSIFATQGLIGDAASARISFIEQNVFTMAHQAGFLVWSSSIAAAVNEVLDAAVNETLFETIYGVIPFKTTLANLIVGIAILFSLFKLFFQLLIAYINIIIQTMLAPIMILFNALPGSTSFSNWVRNFLSNVLIFPAVALLFLTAAVLLGPGDTYNPWDIQAGLITPDSAWTPPFVALQANLEQVMGLIAFGFILFTPNMVSMLQQALKAKPLPTAGVFAPIMAASRVATAPVRGITSGIGGGARAFVTQKIEALAGETRKSR